MRMGAIFFCVLGSFFMGALGTIFVLFVRWAWPAKPDDTFAILFTCLLAAAIGAVAVVAAIWGTISARKIARNQTTFEHLTLMEADGSFQRARKQFNEIVKANNMPEYAHPDHEGSEQAQSIISVLNEYELIAVGIQRGIIDPELYKRLTRSTVIYDWQSSQSFVVALRQRTGRMTIYHEFEEMAGWMNENKLPHRHFWWAGI